MSLDYQEATSGNETPVLLFPVPSQRWEEKPRWDLAISYVLQTLFRPKIFPAVGLFYFFFFNKKLKENGGWTTYFLHFVTAAALAKTSGLK